MNPKDRAASSTSWNTPSSFGERNSEAGRRSAAISGETAPISTPPRARTWPFSRSLCRPTGSTSPWRTRRRSCSTSTSRPKSSKRRRTSSWKRSAWSGTTPGSTRFARLPEPVQRAPLQEPGLWVGGRPPDHHPGQAQGLLRVLLRPRQLFPGRGRGPFPQGHGREGQGCVFVRQGRRL